ncbi:MAG: hypothetical protein AB2421_00850 [Thermotaleaceae bacterium]
MDLLKRTIQGSFLFQCLQRLLDIYKNSTLSRFMDTLGVWIENSQIINYILGKNEGSSAYRHSLLYGILSWLIALLDKLFKWISSFYKQAESGSLVIQGGKEMRHAFERFPLQNGSLLLLGFSIGYLILRFSVKAAFLMLAVNMIALVFARQEVRLREILCGSVLYQLYQYLIDEDGWL